MNLGPRYLKLDAVAYCKPNHVLHMNHYLYVTCNKHGYGAKWRTPSTRNLTGIHGEHIHGARIFQDKTGLISHLSAIFYQFLNRFNS